MQYRLRNLLILLAVLPPFLAWWGWPAMKRIMWQPKPTIQLNIKFTVDFALPIAVPPEVIKPRQATIRPHRNRPPHGSLQTPHTADPDGCGAAGATALFMQTDQLGNSLV